METERAGLPILGFPDAAAWERWLAAEPRSSAGVWLKLAKGGNPEPSLTKAAAIDGALVHGWIDGQIDRFDESWWLTRFTPRRVRSKWSEKNRARAEELIGAGRLAPAGLAEVAAARADGRWDAAYPPQGSAAVPADLAAALDAVPAARTFFDRLDRGNRYAILYRVHEAKRAATREARIARFVAMCAGGGTVHSRDGADRS